jgi:hypothetical protein
VPASSSWACSRSFEAYDGGAEEQRFSDRAIGHRERFERQPRGAGFGEPAVPLIRS